MRIKLTACLLLTAFPPALAAEGIHITSPANQGFYWVVNDGAGFRWDVHNYGYVNDGSNNAFDGAMKLSLNGSYYSHSSNGRLSADGRELEIGPWSYNGLNVYRRIYVDPKEGYCRWIDIFENPGGQPVQTALRYFTDLGTYPTTIATTSGGGAVTDKDWGFVTSQPESSSYPSVAHVYASPRARTKPSTTVRLRSDNVYLNYNLTVPPGKAVAVCTFQAQRRTLADAKKFLADFKPARELRKVPAPLRRIILNMGGAVAVIGSLELPRHEKHDMATLRNGNELLGDLLAEEFVLKTFFGEVRLPAERVVGLAVPTPTDPYVHVGLTDGQVIAGTLVNMPLKFRIGTEEMSLTPSGLATVAFRTSEDRPASIRVEEPMVELRDGQRLLVRPEDADREFLTEYGRVKLRGEELTELALAAEEGGLHRARFRNGSVLSGLLTEEELAVELIGLDRKHTLQRGQVRRFVLPGEPADTKGLSEMTLRNDDLYLGRLAEEHLTLRTDYGAPKIPTATIARLEFDEESLGRVTIKQHNGTVVSGRLLGSAIGFEIAGGPKLDVSVGHIQSVTCPPPPKDSGDVDSSTTKPASNKPDRPLSPEEQVTLRKLTAQRDELRKVREALRADIATIPAAQDGRLKKIEERIQTVKEEIAKLSGGG